MVNELSLRLWVNIQNLLSSLHKDEEGQGTAEYIIMTAVVAFIVGGVVYTAYSGALQSAVGAMATEISDAMP
jgi:hypothetical protein